jgi:hypothetical protein
MDGAKLRHCEPVASESHEELAPLQFVSEHLLAHISGTLPIDGSIDRLEMCTLSIADDAVPCHDYSAVASHAEAARHVVHIFVLLGTMHLLLVKLDRINRNGPLFLPCL